MFWAAFRHEEIEHFRIGGSSSVALRGMASLVTLHKESDPRPETLLYGIEQCR
jgi:hypothetical protein